MSKTKKAKTKYESIDGERVCVVCGWNKETVEDSANDHEAHHEWLKFLAR